MVHVGSLDFRLESLMRFRVHGLKAQRAEFRVQRNPLGFRNLGLGFRVAARLWISGSVPGFGDLYGTTWFGV